MYMYIRLQVHLHVHVHSDRHVHAYRHVQAGTYRGITVVPLARQTLAYTCLLAVLYGHELLMSVSREHDFYTW